MHTKKEQVQAVAMHKIVNKVYCAHNMRILEISYKPDSAMPVRYIFLATITISLLTLCPCSSYAGKTSRSATDDPYLSRIQTLLGPRTNSDFHH